MKYTKYFIPIILLIAIFIYSNYLEPMLAFQLVFGSLGVYIIYLFVLAILAQSKKNIYIAYLLNIFSFTVFITIYFTVVLGLFLLWKRY